MARPREFEPEEVLDDVMHLFWEQGYGPTSITDLVAHTGIHRASLYATFGNKHDLFLAAMRRYHDRVHLELVEILDQPGSSKEAIRRTIQKVARDAFHTANKRGCLLTNSAIEFAPGNDDVMAIVTESLKILRDGFERTIARGQAAGEISVRHSPRQLARFLVSSVQGLAVIGKTGPSKRAVQDVAETTLAILDQ